MSEEKSTEKIKILHYRSRAKNSKIGYSMKEVYYFVFRIEHPSAIQKN
jgi:hypothetical protein